MYSIVSLLIVHFHEHAFYFVPSLPKLPPVPFTIEFHQNYNVISVSNYLLYP